MKNLLIVTTIAVSALTTGTAASDLDLMNAFAISEDLSMENCISIAEQAIAKTGMQVSANPEGGFFRGSSNNGDVLAEVWCMQIAPGVTQAISTVAFDGSSNSASEAARSAFEAIGSVVVPSFEG